MSVTVSGCHNVSLILSDYCEIGLNYIILVAVISFCETMSIHICCISLSVGTKWCENIHGYATSTYATIFSTYVWKHTWIWVSLSEHHFILHLSQQHSAYSFHLHSIPRTKPITTPTHIYMLQLHCSVQTLFLGTSVASAPRSVASLHITAVSSPTSASVAGHLFPTLAGHLFLLLGPVRAPSLSLFPTLANIWHRHLPTSSNHKYRHPDARIVQAKPEINLKLQTSIRIKLTGKLFGHL